MDTFRVFLLESVISLNKPTSLYKGKPIMSGSVKRHFNKDKGRLPPGLGKGQKVDGLQPSQGEAVKLNIDIECTRDFVEKLLREYTLTVRTSTPYERHLEVSYSPAGKGDFLIPERIHPRGEQKEIPASSKAARKQQRWLKRIVLGVFLVILMSIGALVGKIYLKGNQNLPSILRHDNITHKNDQAYRALLAKNLDALVRKLDQLCSIPRMREAFPEITTLSDIVMTKRGPEPAEQAKAAIEYIWRVKYLFDRWVKGSKDFPPELKPTQKDVSYFLSLWRETNVLIESAGVAGLNQEG